MKTITIREANDVVYFLSTTKGFVKGWIKRTFVESITKHKINQDSVSPDKFKNKPTDSCNTIVKYFVTCDMYNTEYMGDEIKEDQLFDTKEEMIEYYKNKSELF